MSFTYLCIESTHSSRSVMNLYPTDVPCLAADAEIEISNLTTAARELFSTHVTLPPLGHDPTFQPASRLWEYDLIAREGEYYNTSQVHMHSHLHLSDWHTCIGCDVASACKKEADTCAHTPDMTNSACADTYVQLPPSTCFLMCPDQETMSLVHGQQACYAKVQHQLQKCPELSCL